MSRRAGCRRVDRQPGNEMIDAAICRVDRNARYRGPGRSGRRRAHHDIVRRATTPEPTVLPDHVDLPGSVNLGGGERVGSSPPATRCLLTDDTVTAAFQLTPPVVEVNARMALTFELAMGTTTVPFGWTRGCPPDRSRCWPLPGLLQVTPPSVDVDIRIRLLWLLLSNST